MTTPEFLRTPDENFVGLEGFNYEPHYLDIDGLRMHYIDEGPRDGQVILMLHGMPTWSYLYRHIIKDMTAAGYRCIAPDHIGFGRSDKVTDANWYNIAQHTANMKTLIEKLDLERDYDFGTRLGRPHWSCSSRTYARAILSTRHHEYMAASRGI